MQSIIQFAVLLTVFVAIIAVGYTVYKGARNTKVNRVFFFLSLSIAGWILTNFLFQIFDNTSLKYITALLSYGFAVSLAYQFYAFCTLISAESNLKKSRDTGPKRVNAILALCVGLLSVFPGVIATGISDDSAIISNSITLLLYGLFIIYLFAQGLYFIVRSVFVNSGQAQKRFITIFISIILAIIIGLFFNLILPLMGNYNYVAYGPTGTMFLVFGIAFATFKYQLFEIRIVIARLVAYSASILLLVAIYILVGVLVIRLVLGADQSTEVQVALAIISASLAILFRPIKVFFDKATNRIFYRDMYVAQDVINKINSTLVNTNNLEKTLEATSGIIEVEVKVQYASFLIMPSIYQEQRAIGSNLSIFSSKEWMRIYKYLETSNKHVIYIGQPGSEFIDESLKTLEIQAVVKLIASKDTVGLIVIGDKKSGNAMSTSDIQLFEIIAGSVAIAAQNMLRFQEIEQFNRTLQQKVDEAVRQVQKTNQKLISLDQAKDDFISMASHQLRTPLTSIKGYISMLLEGDAGPINKTQKQFLEQAFTSSQRMVYLIADLLNVSRLKTGKFVIELKPTFLPEVVETEVRQLIETARSRELELHVHIPKDFPTIMLDETKIRQVIMNFADNAIYYTPRGGRIDIELKKNNKSIEYLVIDSGIGVPNAEQHHLFTKFYRAGNARKARPDGTGLGLYMAKKVITAQGGSIIFKTREGQGSTFGFSFPRHDKL